MDGWYIDSYVSIRQIYLNEMHISSKHLNLRHNNTKRPNFFFFFHEHRDGHLSYNRLADNSVISIQGFVKERQMFIKIFNK